MITYFTIVTFVQPYHYNPRRLNASYNSRVHRHALVLLSVTIDLLISLLCRGIVQRHSFFMFFTDMRVQIDDHEQLLRRRPFKSETTCKCVINTIIMNIYLGLKYQAFCIEYNIKPNARKFFLQ